MPKMTMTMWTRNSRGMRIVLLALCAVVLGTGAIQAQDTTGAPPPPQQGAPPSPPPQQGGPGQGPGGRPGPERMQQRHLEMLTRQLQLTPGQVDQVKAIQGDTMQQMMALREDTATAQQDKRAKMMAIRQGAQDKIRGVLTDEQKTKFDAMQARMQQQREHHEGGPGGPPTPAPSGQTPPPPSPPQS